MFSVHVDFTFNPLLFQRLPVIILDTLEILVSSLK